MRTYQVKLMFQIRPVEGSEGRCSLSPKMTTFIFTNDMPLDLIERFLTDALQTVKDAAIEDIGTVL